jgi:hypothetical protein
MSMKLVTVFEPLARYRVVNSAPLPALASQEQLICLQPLRVIQNQATEGKAWNPLTPGSCTPYLEYTGNIKEDAPKRRKLLAFFSKISTRGRFFIE